MDSLNQIQGGDWQWCRINILSRLLQYTSTVGQPIPNSQGAANIDGTP